MAPRRPEPFTPLHRLPSATTTAAPLPPPPPPPPWPAAWGSRRFCPLQRAAMGPPEAPADPARHQPLDPSQASAAVVRLSRHCAALGLSEAGWRQLQRQLDGFTAARAERAREVLDAAAIRRLNAGLSSLDEGSWFAAGRPHR